MKSIILLALCGFFTAPIFAQNLPPAPPPPPPPPNLATSQDIYKVVENQPLFPGCESETDRKLLNQCSKEKAEKFIQENLTYPPIAKANGIEGVVYVKFVVEKDGSITEAKVLRDIGAGCGQEALRIISLMPNWIPGRQRGVPVRVQINMPVKFSRL
ncbi:MAG: energy transducer TonB [Saprospiraceae bacterium]|nr:energy transducer TonB [Saprospiraceae bacterium]MCF8251027.1 energy transducer TonB [Saprospiraceae bacterium]MCF8281483.1 energy transducer TonB [Bacteroidales bacterium]MCF8311624.1 energy transducer TonB [Saprospiraceae bacterium]MCF8440965.1 energy transducer TonB [Saprospiraceae bacterium]